MSAYVKPTALIALLFITLTLSGCSHSTNVTQKNDSFKKTIDRYFSIYAQRNNFKNFMSFYADNAVLHDIVYGNNLKNKAEIERFFAWDKGEFSVIDNNLVLSITRQNIDNNRVITEGVFHQFSYNNETFGPWMFIMIHEFDQNNKIIQQTDWINYTPKEKFIGGINMNTTLIP